MVELLNKLFTSREIAHVLHLKAKGDGSYAAHKALNEYYDSIVDLIDSLAEVYQGQFGIIDFADVMNVENVDYSDTVKYFDDLVKYVESKRGDITKKSLHLNNQIDDIVGLLYSTIYKLKFLK